MEITTQHPLVSIAVIAYNSAEYILETLESIKAQTYDNIELVVSDDCSTDGTVELCRKWIDDHLSRFAAVHLLESPTNTGQSGNYNRAFDACTGEWIKEIDGDDKLLPNCVSDFIEYTQKFAEAKYVFGKMIPFGSEVTCNDFYNEAYAFFGLSPEEQLHELIYKGNSVPSPTSFYNRAYIIQKGFRNDERIPLLEDYPKWIKLLQLGVRFCFMDKEVVAYRVNSGISTQRRPSEAFHRSQLLCDMYYRWPEWINNDEKDGMNRIVESQMKVYRQLLQSDAEVQRLQNTKAYRLGKIILKPFSVFKKQK